MILSSTKTRTGKYHWFNDTNSTKQASTAIDRTIWMVQRVIIKSSTHGTQADHTTEINGVTSDKNGVNKNKTKQNMAIKSFSNKIKFVKLIYRDFNYNF